MERRLGIAFSRDNGLDEPLSTNTVNILTSQQERALRSLARAISLSAQRFSLILVRSSYPESKESALQALREQYSVEPQVLYLPETARSLFAAIHPIKQPPQQGLIVFGLETVAQLDEFLITTNQMRNEFRLRFHFPLVLWVNDITIRKLIKLAPDFYSWASAPINLG